MASVPAGSGIVITSNDKVEVFDNEIRNNQTANIIISSVYSTNYAGMSAQPNYDAYPEGIFIYGNTLEGRRGFAGRFRLEDSQDADVRDQRQLP